MDNKWDKWFNGHNGLGGQHVSTGPHPRSKRGLMRSKKGVSEKERKTEKKGKKEHTM